VKWDQPRNNSEKGEGKIRVTRENKQCKGRLEELRDGKTREGKQGGGSYRQGFTRERQGGFRRRKGEERAIPKPSVLSLFQEKKGSRRLFRGLPSEEESVLDAEEGVLVKKKAYLGNAFELR